MAGVMFGFIFRMAMLTVAVVLLRKFDWIEDIPLLFTVLITHIGLLMWETRYVSMSLAYPGLKPRPNARDARSAIGQQFHQAFVREDLQRLAQGRARNAQLVGQDPFRQMRTWRQFAGGDHVPHLHQHGRMQAGGATPRSLGPRAAGGFGRNRRWHRETGDE
jgi:hypothetical protein